VEKILDETGEISYHLLAKNLDDEQVEAVMTTDTNVVVRANAGAGKTRVLVNRVAFLIANGVPEQNILLLTFTNKASNEMKERLDVLLNRSVTLSSGTFHKIGVQLLRQFSLHVGLTKNFTILDIDDSRQVVASIREELLKVKGIKKKEFPEARVIQRLISSSINCNVPMHEIVYENHGNMVVYIEEIEEIANEYKKKKEQINGIDFDDILVKTVELLKNPTIRRTINKEYTHILVDEYQDVNHLQDKILMYLNWDNQHLYVVGDENQAIYRFRGADIKFIQEFTKRYNNTESHYITRNYRSDGYILELAEKSINQNYYPDAPTVITPFLPYEIKPQYLHTNTEDEQVSQITKKISDCRKRGVAYEDMAILLRTNFNARIFEKAFRRENIPYQLLSGTSFFERKHIKDIMSFLRLLENPLDEIAFNRSASLFDGLGKKTVSTLYNRFEMSGCNFDMLAIADVPKRASEGFESWVNLILELVRNNNSIAEKIIFIRSYFYENFLMRTDEDYKVRKEELDDLVTLSGNYKDLSKFLEEMTLEPPEESNEKGVIITTVHKSKGLEYNIVFLPNMVEGMFPSSKSEGIEAIKDERRLFYVAITRAKKELYIYSYSSSFYASTRLYPSTFMEELPNGLWIP